MSVYQDPEGEDFDEDDHDEENPMENPYAVSANPVFDVVDGHCQERTRLITVEKLNNAGKAGLRSITEVGVSPSGKITISGFALLYICSNDGYLFDTLISSREQAELAKICESSIKRLNDLTVVSPTSKKFNEFMRNY